MEERVFVESAFNMRCHIVKNTLLHIAFSEQADLFSSSPAKELNEELRWDTDTFTYRLSEFLKDYPAGKIAKNTHWRRESFCLIGTQNTMPSCKKYTPPVCVFRDFAGWVSARKVSSFFFQAEDGIRDAQESRGLGDVYKRQNDNK